MEQRYCNRQPLRERVELWNGVNKFGEFETANISDHGIFIEGCQQEIGANQYLTIKFANNPNLSFHPSRRALVVRKSEVGVGFVWTNINKHSSGRPN